MFERMHLFHSKSAEVYITVKYRSSSILVITGQFWLTYGPFSINVFVVGLRYRFPFNKFGTDALISYDVCKGYIIVKYRSNSKLVIIREILAKL